MTTELDNDAVVNSDIGRTQTENTVKKGIQLFIIYWFLYSIIFLTTYEVKGTEPGTEG